MFNHMQRNKIEKFSFLWSEARLVIAALALFIGGIPPLVAYGPFPSGLTRTLLVLSWIISGLASGYLLYEWSQHRKLFASKKPFDVAAFAIMVISGINLGITGLFGRNIGMSISSNRTLFIIVGLLYLYVAYYLYNRWSASGKKLF